MEVSVSLLVPGCVLLKDVNDIISKQQLLPALKILTKDDIMRLQIRGIKKVFVKMDSKNETFANHFNIMVISAIKEGNITKIQELATVYEKYLNTLIDIKFDFSKYVYNMDKEINMYKHIVNVVNMSVTIAYYYNKTVSKKDIIPIDKLAIAGMLEDLGRTAYNPNVLKLLEKKYLSTVNSMRREFPGLPGNLLYKYLPDYHGLYGYLLLQDVEIDETIKKTILFHNERYNDDSVGLGIIVKNYKKDKLAVKLSSVIKVADIYDGILFEGPKKNIKEPFKSIPKMISLLVNKEFINADAAKLMMTSMPLYRVGSIVRLSDERLGIVSRVDPLDQFNPTVVDFDYRYIDMKKERIRVVSLVSENALRKRIKTNK